MRSAALVATALVAGVLASPMAKPQNVVIDWEIVTVYQTITITGEPPARTPAPTFASSRVEEPKVVESNVAEVIVEEPKYEEPVVEEPVFEEPKYEEPVIEEPVIEEPVVEEPKYEAAPEMNYGSDYKGSCLKHHNLHRANHSANPLEWDDGLAATAQRIGETCVYAHNT